MILNKTEIVFFITLMLVAGIIVPVTSAENVNNLSLMISSIEEGGTIYSDVIGSNIPIYVDTSSIYGIDEVTITNGINKSICRKEKESRYLCLNPWHQGLNSINITATDKSGNSISQLRNYTLVRGINPPPKRSMTQSNTQSSGFCFYIGIASLIIGLFLFFVKR